MEFVYFFTDEFMEENKNNIEKDKTTGLYTCTKPFKKQEKFEEIKGSFFSAVIKRAVISNEKKGVLITIDFKNKKRIANEQIHLQVLWAEETTEGWIY